MTKHEQDLNQCQTHSVTWRFIPFQELFIPLKNENAEFLLQREDFFNSDSPIVITDVNLVAEPKPHQIGKKRPNVAKSSGDWWVFISRHFYVLS